MTNNKTQIARIIFLEELTIMKKILSLAEFKFDQRTKEYQYFKSQVMDNFYNGLKKLFKKFEEQKIIEKCSCNSKLRQGYQNCPHCGGAGYCNV